jgi:hypothetical protein
MPRGQRGDGLELSARDLTETMIAILRVLY